MDLPSVAHVMDGLLSCGRLGGNNGRMCLVADFGDAKKCHSRYWTTHQVGVEIIVHEDVSLGAKSTATMGYNE